MARSLVLFILILALFVRTAPAAESFELATPRPVPTTTVFAPHVAANSGGFLSAWYAGEWGDIQGAPLTVDGARRFQSAVGIFPARKSALGLEAIAPLGDGFLVQIRDSDRYGVSEFLRVDSDGRYEGHWITEVDLASYRLIAAAPGGDRFLVAPKLPKMREALVLDESGAIARRVTLAFDRGPDGEVQSSSASDGEFVLVGGMGRSLDLQRIGSRDSTRDAVVKVAEAEGVSGLFVFAVVATTGDEALVVYQERPQGDATPIKAARVTRTAGLVPLHDFKITSTWEAAYSPERPIALYWTGDHYVFMRTSYSTLQAIRIGASGTPIDVVPIMIDDSRQYWRVTNRGDSFYVVAAEERGGSVVVVGGMIRSSPAGISPFFPEPLSNTTASQTQAEVATDGVNYFAVWREGALLNGWARGPLRGAFFTAGGTVLETLDLPIAADPFMHDVAFAGGVYAVTWVAGQALHLVRVSMDGTILDPVPIVLATGLTDFHGFAIGSNGHRFLVAWSAGARFELVPVTTDGVPGNTVPARRGPSAPGIFGCCLIASDGKDYVVAFRRVIPGTGFPGSEPTHTFIEAAAVTAEGSPSDAVSIGAENFEAGLAWNGTNYVLLDWSRQLWLLDRNARPVASPQQLHFPSAFGVHLLGLHSGGGRTSVLFRTFGYLTLGQNHIGSINEAGVVRGYAFAQPTRGYSEDMVELAMNAAGELIAVLNEARSDPFGARSRRTVVYRLPPVSEPWRRRAAGR